MSVIDGTWSFYDFIIVIVIDSNRFLYKNHAETDIAELLVKPCMPTIVLLVCLRTKELIADFSITTILIFTVAVLMVRLGAEVANKAFEIIKRCQK